MNNLILLSGAGGKAWSGDPTQPDPEIVKPGTTVYTVGSRAVYRHISDKGSVIQWTDKSGVVHKTLVLDAQYRCGYGSSNGGRYWGGSASPSGMTAYTNTYYYLATGTTSSGSPSSTSGFDSSASSFTDAIINGRSTYFEDNHTSAYNTDKLIAQWPSSTYAANWCRSNGSGIVADLPNVQTLIRIYLCAEKLDALDPTKGSYSVKKLSGWMGSGWIWSSTLYSSNNAWTVVYSGYVDDNFQNSGRGVVPVAEL